MQGEASEWRGCECYERMKHWRMSPALISPHLNCTPQQVTGFEPPSGNSFSSLPFSSTDHRDTVVAKLAAAAQSKVKALLGPGEVLQRTLLSEEEPNFAMYLSMPLGHHAGPPTDMLLSMKVAKMKALIVAPWTAGMRARAAVGGGGGGGDGGEGDGLGGDGTTNAASVSGGTTHTASSGGGCSGGGGGGGDGDGGSSSGSSSSGWTFGSKSLVKASDQMDGFGMFFGGVDDSTGDGSSGNGNGSLPGVREYGNSDTATSSDEFQKSFTGVLSPLTPSPGGAHNVGQFPVSSPAPTTRGSSGSGGTGGSSGLEEYHLLMLCHDHEQVACTHRSTNQASHHHRSSRPPPPPPPRLC